MDTNITTQTDYENFLKGKSDLELVSLVSRLDDLKDYIKVTEDEQEAKQFVEKEYPDLPIHTKEEFLDFYDRIYERIEELSEHSKSLELCIREHYGIGVLPKRVSFLEEKANSLIPRLTETVKASLNYVWDLVFEEGFDMSGVKLLLGGRLEIGQYQGNLCIGLKKGEHKEQRLTISKEEKKEREIVEKKKFLLWTLNHRISKIQTFEAEEGDFFICHGWGIKETSGDTESIVRELIEDSQSFNEYYSKDRHDFLQVLCSLPHIINKTLSKKEQKVQELEKYCNE